MTKRAQGSRLTDSHVRVPLFIAALGMAACQAAVGDGPQGSGDDTDTKNNSATGSGTDAGASVVNPGSDQKNNPTSDPPASSDADAGQQASGGPPGSLPPCATSAANAKDTLTNYCAGCHGADSAGLGGFKTVLDVSALISDGKVVPNQPDNSPLYKRLSGGTMPPTSVAKRPDDDAIKAVKDWITCGAPDFNNASDPNTVKLDFLDINTRSSTVLNDLLKLPNPNDRQDMRYIDLSNLANAGYTKDQLEVYRQTVSMLVNSLSLGKNVVAPTAIDDQQLLLRIDLEDYGWDASTWNQFEQVYPYAVVYNENSRLFPFDEVTSDRIRQETGTQIPIIQADWFISHGSRPPIYFSVLQIPNTLDELAQQFGVNREKDVANQQVLRAGFANAGPSQNHRVIERHDLPGNRGAFWSSFDFSNNLGDHNIFAHPLDFVFDGGETIVNLDNGLQAYFINNGQTVRVDKAPTNIVQDPAARDGAVECGISCMNCHQTSGQLPKFDEIRDFVLASGTDAATTEEVLALYADRPTLEDAFQKDQNLYLTARSALGIDKVTDTTFHEVDNTHLDLMDINAVASVLGIPTKDLERAIDSTPQVFPAAITTLRTEGGAIQRDEFEDTIDQLIAALGLGTPLKANVNANNVNNANNANVNNANASSSSSSTSRKR